MKFVIRHLKFVFDIKKIGGEKIIGILISLFFLLLYSYSQSLSIYGGDAGDLVTAAFVRGIAHPPGYPLYTFIGWLLTKIPIFTIAWRVSLLSSIPSAMTLGILFLIVNKLIKNTWISSISVLVLGFNYLFWLYAIVPEVFALNSFFLVSILYLLLQFSITKTIKYLYWAFFVLGLSITHHQIIILIIPGYYFLIRKNLPRISKSNLNVYLNFLSYFLLGFLPYIYVFWAAKGTPPINWENPVNFQDFFRLISRSIYGGSFRSHSSFGLLPIDRWYELKFFIESYFIDFTKLGVILGLIGIVYQFFYKRQQFLTIGICFLFTGPIFFFYASFPLLSNFYLATSERFLLMSYIFFSIWIGEGILFIITFLNELFKKYINKKVFSTTLLFIIFPASLFLTSYPKLKDLKNDQTAENFGIDVLSSVEDNSILFLFDDTSVFNTQYVYYTNKIYQQKRKIKIIGAGLLSASFYQETLKNNYPQLDLTNLGLTKQTNPVLAIAEKYFNQYPIYSTAVIDMGNNYGWIQKGLVYKLQKSTDPDDTNKFIQSNEDAFANLHNPLAGALASYQHVMLDDTAKHYVDSYYDFGKKMIDLCNFKLAEKYLTLGYQIQPSNIDNLLQLRISFIMQNKCQEAENLNIDNTQNVSNNPLYYKSQAIYYQNCKNDKPKVQEFEKLYKEKLNEGQTKLNNF